MELDARKRTILTAIIRTYLETGEPVGSRTISKYTDLNLSSATIRNEMSDLEDMGYILQPHTSAGRIPSDKGYRLYVDEIIRVKDQEVSDMKEMMIQKTDKLEKILKQVVKILASNTNYATMITGPVFNQARLKFVQLSRVRETQLLAVIVTEGNRIKNQLIDATEPLTDEEILKLNLLLNTHMNGRTIGEINLDMISEMKQQAGIHREVVSGVVDAVAEAIRSDKEDIPVFTSGANNIFRYPELSDSSRASELIAVLEDKTELAQVLDSVGDEAEIQVLIGQETRINKMEDCSVVTTTYDLGKGMKGTIGIVGPKRMDYENVVDNLKVLRAQLDSIFYESGPDDEKDDKL